MRRVSNIERVDLDRTPRPSIGGRIFEGARHAAKRAGAAASPHRLIELAP